MRILVIEDDSLIKKTIEKTFKKDGFHIFQSETGSGGIDLGKNYPYDLIILDLLLPDMHGKEVLKKIRKGKVKTPIIILSNIKEVKDKVDALSYGADDYITKPFSNEELKARVYNLIRRHNGHPEARIKTGKLTIDITKRMVFVDGKKNPIHLTKKEYAIIELLSLKKETLVTKEMFLNHLYNGLQEPGAKIVDVIICKLRKKLYKINGQENIIFTDWGRGYILKNPIA